MWRVLGNILCDLDPPQGQGQIMYFLVNASSPKLLQLQTLQVHRSHDKEGTW